MRLRISLPPRFPFLFGGTFIEGGTRLTHCTFRTEHFPSFSEGLSLRGDDRAKLCIKELAKFPFLFGGTFIEGEKLSSLHYSPPISLPFRRDFH